MKLKVGGRFKIKPPKGSAVTRTWGNQIFVAHAIGPQKIRGYDSDLQLGEMVTFQADFGRRGKVWHCVPLSWAHPVEKGKPR